MASSSNWTSEQNKLFENALTLIDEDAPGCWEVVAKAVGDKTVEEVKRHYEMLVHDIGLIEAGRFPLPKYKSATKAAATNTSSSSNKRG